MWIKFGGLAWTNVNTDIGGSYFKLVDDQSLTRARHRHTPTLSNCTHTLNRIIDWGEWLPRQVYTYYNTRTSFNQSSNMESELALHSRASRFQEHSDSTYRWAVILQKRNRQCKEWYEVAVLWDGTTAGCVPRTISAACALFVVVSYWHAWASTGDLFLQDLQLALASLISLLLSDGTCVDITFTRINTVTCPLFAPAQIGNNCSNPLTCNCFAMWNPFCVWSNMNDLILACLIWQ